MKALPKYKELLADHLRLVYIENLAVNRFGVARKIIDPCRTSDQ